VAWLALLAARCCFAAARRGQQQLDRCALDSRRTPPTTQQQVEAMAHVVGARGVLLPPAGIVDGILCISCRIFGGWVITQKHLLTTRWFSVPTRWFQKFHNFGCDSLVSTFSTISRLSFSSRHGSMSFQWK